VSIKTLLFVLFLYVCLVWVGAHYCTLAPSCLEFGFRWTALGLIAVLAFVIGARILGWWRLWRAKSAIRPAAAAKPTPMVHEDDAALAALITEANAGLAAAPGYAERRGRAPLSGMPLYLLIGPEASGKTSTLLNSGWSRSCLLGK